MNKTYIGLAIAFALAVSASAQSYSIDWYTIGGGGTSTSGVYPERFNWSAPVLGRGNGQRPAGCGNECSGTTAREGSPLGGRTPH